MQEMRYCRALYDVISVVDSHLEPREVLESIVEMTSQVMALKGCSIMLLTPDRRELRHSISHGLSEWYVQKGPLDLDSTIPEVLDGHPVAVLDIGDDSRIQFTGAAIREGIASMLSVPIRLRDEVVGVMRLYTSEPREFAAEEVEFLEAVASLGAIALDNARRYAAVETNLRSLEAYVFRYAGA